MCLAGYGVLYPGGDSIHPRQPVIQRFNKFGEAIEDPTMLAQHISPADTLHIQMWNSYLDNNDNIHVLWRGSSRAKIQHD